MADTTLPDAPTDPAAATTNGVGGHASGSASPQLSSNQVATQYIIQNGFTKAHNAMVAAAEQETATSGLGGSRADAMDVDKDDAVGDGAASTSRKTTSFSKPHVVERGLKESDFNKRNLPVAQNPSASTRAYYMTDEFMAQAADIVNRHKKENVVGDGLLDASDRVKGYVRLRRWVESGLEGWKVSWNGIMGERKGFNNRPTAGTARAALSRVRPYIPRPH